MILLKGNNWGFKESFDDALNWYITRGANMVEKMGGSWVQVRDNYYFDTHVGFLKFGKGRTRATHAMYNIALSQIF